MKISINFLLQLGLYEDRKYIHPADKIILIYEVPVSLSGSGPSSNYHLSNVIEMPRSV